MKIRFLTQDDVAEHNKISSQAFVYACEVNDPASVLPCPKVLGAFDDDDQTLLADFELQERTCYYDGGLLTCAAIGGVAAKPEHRGKGAVTALFQHLFREKQYDISILYPFSEPYYRKLCYERAGCSVSVTVPFSGLSHIPRNQDAALYEGADAAGLLAAYNRCAERYNLCFVRETAEAFSANPYASQCFTYLWKNRALAAFSVDRGKSTVFVKELYFDSCESMRGILGFLRNFEANQKYVCFENLPADTPLLRYVQDMKQCDVRLHPVGAVRILNVEAVLKAHRYPPKDGVFTIAIENETYRVAHTAKGVSVEKDARFTPEVSMDVGWASQALLCGLTDADYCPGLTVHDPASDFFLSFPPKTTFFSDNL